MIKACDNFVDVRISAAMLRLKFIQCGPACIAGGCSGKCCDAPTRPTGMMVTIHPTEQSRIEARGGVVVSGMLQPETGCKGCPFKKNGLCSLHETPDKPFGCIASPFTLNANDLLIVRNRYKMLPCYRGTGHKQAAYVTFISSLNLIFGWEKAKMIVSHLDEGGGNLFMPMPKASYDILHDNDHLKSGQS